MVQDSNFEHTVANNFPKYVQDEELLNIPIHIMYRIMSIYTSKNSITSRDEQINNFLIKYLQKHGKDASVLFELIKFEDDSNNYLLDKIVNYSKIFDFRVLFSSIVGSKDELQNKFIHEMLQLRLQMIEKNHLINLQKDELANQKKNIQKQQIEINQLKEISNKLHNIILNDPRNILCNQNIDEFNKLDGNSQMSIISEINEKDNLSNTLDILKLISEIENEYDNAIDGKNYIYLNTKNTINEFSNIKEIDSIIISSYSTQMLYDNGYLNRYYFVNMLKNFNEVFFEINGFYPYYA